MESAKKRLERLVEQAESGQVDRKAAAATAFKIAAEALEHHRTYQGKDGDERSYPDPQFGQAAVAMKIGLELSLEPDGAQKPLDAGAMRKAGLRAVAS